MRFLIKETESAKVSERLTVKDKKLVQLLVQDSRLSVTQLAKKIGISKSAIVQKIRALEKKGVLMSPVLYTSVKALDKAMYVLSISTQLGMSTKKVNEELLKIKEVSGVLWYNGAYNLVVGIMGDDPGDVVDEIEKVVKIKKFQIVRVRDNWFHPLHLFKEVKDVGVKFERFEGELEVADKKILNHLHDNPTSTFSELAEGTRLAVQTIKKRLDGLRKSGAVLGFSRFVNPWLCGKEVVSVSFVVKGRRDSDRLVKHLLEVPEVGNIWEYDHEWNIGAVFWVDHHADANRIINNVYKNFEIMDIEVMVLVGMVGK